MAAQLRQQGVEMSELLREAIRTEYGRRRRMRPADVDAILDAIHARHPDPPGVTADRLESDDRRAFRAAIRRRVRRHGAA